jgi:hypothetical protein
MSRPDQTERTASLPWHAGVAAQGGVGEARPPCYAAVVAPGHAGYARRRRRQPQGRRCEIKTRLGAA